MTKEYTPSSNRELIKVLLPYYKKNLKIFISDMAFAAFTTICELVLPILLATITDVAASRPSDLTMGFIGRIAIIYIILRLLEVVAQYYMQSTGHIMGATIERDMRADVYRHIHTLPHEFFATSKTGAILASLTTDLFDITEFSHHWPEEMLIGLIKLIVSFVILIQVDVVLTLVIFAIIPFLFITSTYFRRKMRREQMNQRKQIGNINSSIEDSILGIQVVKSFANEDIEEEKFEVDNSRFLDIKAKFYHALAGFNSVTRFFDGLMLTVVIIGGGISLINNRISPGQFIAFILYVQTLLATVQRVVQFTEQFEKGMTGLERFRSIMQKKSNIIEKEDAIKLKDVKGHIVLDQIDFAYPNSKENVIDKLDIEIQPGQQIAIVGPSGGGKTTLTNLIPRFYDVTGGKITIDGNDIRDVTLDSLRNSIGMVQQDVYLFSGTIRENIEYGRPGASHEEIEEAARLADAYDFITNLPHGFDSYVGERGVMLSGGQKQRISIARVFLKNPPILILDEATSALDNRTEKWIQASLEKLAKGRTTITIAHRLSTIKNADRILVLTKDGLIESGDHATLMANKGPYYRLYQVIENQEVLEKNQAKEERPSDNPDYYKVS